jgi:flotillin
MSPPGERDGALEQEEIDELLQAVEGPVTNVVQQRAEPALELLAPSEAAWMPAPIQQPPPALEVNPMENKYLEEVKAKQEAIEGKLKKKRAPAPQRAARASSAVFDDDALIGSASASAGGTELPAPAVDVRITGFWRFRTVVVPPNAYVVHTTRGREAPVTLGMGKSFRFNPYKDAYLVVPATTQTILISAPCICREHQGILVQGYVQWIIEDFAKTYRKLDFSDPVDPMRIVNTQLKEQAEATIKDTVATMSIDDVSSDKQPIIKELTRRLREVTEGDNKQKGLGLGIVTVQIKEAVVSSARLWETL